MEQGKKKVGWPTNLSVTEKDIQKLSQATSKLKGKFTVISMSNLKLFGAESWLLCQWSR